MEGSHAASAGVGDRLSKLSDHALGHVLSFLPAEDAARAALLSSRWRHVFGAVHTVSLEQPESPIPNYDDDRGSYSPGWCPLPDPNASPPFYSVVSAAIIARQRRRGAVPLRALRVAVGRYLGLRGDALTVDQWVSYAVQQGAAEGLDLDLRLWCRRPVFDRPYALRRRGQQQQHENDVGGRGILAGRLAKVEVESGILDAEHMVEKPESTIDAAGSDDDVVTSDSDSSDDDGRSRRDRWPWVVPEYTATRAIFSCAHLRSLSLSSCRLAPSDAVSLPSLVTLLLSHVSDPGSDVERLVASCPRLADLTLEACGAVTALSIVGGGGARLRRLALRCCHNLTAVAVDSSELQAFEYRGAVTDGSFLTMRGGGGGSTRIAYGKVDICGEEATSEDDLEKLGQLLQLFANAKHLHLESARLGSGLDKGVPPLTLPSFSSLLHLEMRGRLPDDVDDDTGGAAIAAVSRVLEHAPNLETLSLAFHPQEHGFASRGEYSGFSEEELLDAHHLSYNPHSVLAAPSAVIIPCCLRSKVREMNLVHYQGGTAQRALAKFLLSNAPVVEKLWCGFAEGPMWTQVQLMREIQSWLINKSAITRFA